MVVVVIVKVVKKKGGYSCTASGNVSSDMQLWASYVVVVDVVAGKIRYTGDGCSKDGEKCSKVTYSDHIVVNMVKK